jgi:HEAT repeat protein
LLSLLAEFDDSRDATIIPDLLPLVSDCDRRVSERAATAITEIIDRVAPAALAGLDAIIRQSYVSLWTHERGWLPLSPADLDRDIRDGGVPPALLGLATMHPSGHVREAAVRRLAARIDGSEVSYLLIRLNDWIPVIRETARAALQSRLHRGYARHLIRNLALLVRLAECSRDDHWPFVASVVDLLRKAECRPALLEGTASTDRFVRRTCFRLAIDVPEISLKDVLTKALHDNDPLVRLWSARAARSRLVPVEFQSLMPVLERDHFVPVRREALCGLVEKSPELAHTVLLTALLDPHVSMREVARYYLGKSGGFESRSFYQDTIRSTAPDLQLAAIAGLGETGTAEDADLITPYLEDPRTRIRRAAVVALARVGGDHHSGMLLRMLEDDRPSVTHAAREALRGRLHLVREQQLWHVFMNDRRAHVRENALALLAALGKWRSLPFLIRACADEHPDIRLKARMLLENWLKRINRSFVPHTAEELQSAREALALSRAFLAREVSKHLDTLLKDR